MNGHFFWGVMIIAVLIFWYEWPRMKESPKKDKVSFIVLMLLVCFLSFFDLRNLWGPNQLLELIFKPFGKIMD